MMWASGHLFPSSHLLLMMYWMQTRPPGNKEFDGADPNALMEGLSPGAGASGKLEVLFGKTSKPKAAAAAMPARAKSGPSGAEGGAAGAGSTKTVETESVMASAGAGSGSSKSTTAGFRVAAARSFGAVTTNGAEIICKLGLLERLFFFFSRLLLLFLPLLRLLRLDLLRFFLRPRLLLLELLEWLDLRFFFFFLGLFGTPAAISFAMLSALWTLTPVLTP
mmetsp:Transcript_78787/g.219005  ORF Transcript_78787/g.219005 Transcript_78787/m.219005 type:complete len:221 (+) Transcript_78787:293-955(+)